MLLENLQQNKKSPIPVMYSLRKRGIYWALYWQGLYM